MPHMSSALDADWLGACRRAGEGLRTVLRDNPTSRERVIETGTTGGGGDQTLVIDQAAEDAVFAELDRLHDEGVRFCAVSEERGMVDYGDPGIRVVIDPIDGSMNAKRGLTHHALSIAVADGPTMGDVALGYVLDLGPEEEWWARRGEGAWLDGERLEPPGERRTRQGRLELVAIESASPRWIAAAGPELELTVGRVRAIGSIALPLWQVGAARVDRQANVGKGRGARAPAAAPIQRESGGAASPPRRPHP